MRVVTDLSMGTSHQKNFDISNDGDEPVAKRLALLHTVAGQDDRGA